MPRRHAPRVAVAPIDTPLSFKNKAYAALKNVIVRWTSITAAPTSGSTSASSRSDFGISRTPVREAMAQLEREGFVRSVPRRGIYVVRKTKNEVIEMITAWAALESMAARLITENASDDEIASLRRDVRELRERAAARPSRRIFRGEYRVSPDHHPHERQQRADRSGGEPVHPYAHDPAQDDRREGPRRPLDPRSHEHHRGAGGARHRARRDAGARPCARPCRARRANTPIIWTKKDIGRLRHG